MKIEIKINYHHDNYFEIFGIKLKYVYYNSYRTPYKTTKEFYSESRLCRYFERMVIRYGKSWRNFYED